MESLAAVNEIYGVEYRGLSCRVNRKYSTPESSFIFFREQKTNAHYSRVKLNIESVPFFSRPPPLL